MTTNPVDMGSCGGGGGGGTPFVCSDLVSCTTDDLAEGSTNKYYTDEKAQDAVGGILTDSASVDFTYNDGANTITAAVIAAGVDHGSLGGLSDDDHTQYVLRSILTNNGDIFIRASGVVTRLGIGSTGDVLTVSGGAPIWTPPTPPTIGIWMPDAPPSSAGAEDDEFADNSGGVPGGWTEYDHGTLLTVAEDVRGVLFTQTTTGANAGIYKTIPAGDFTYWTKTYITQWTNQQVVGMGLLEDGSSSTGDVVTHGCDISGAIRTMTWSSYNGFSGISGSVAFATAIYHFYSRIRRTGTTYSFDFSFDGSSWWSVYSGTIPFTPTHIALLNYNNTGATQEIVFPFFRYLASDVGLTGIAKGKRI